MVRCAHCGIGREGAWAGRPGGGNTLEEIGRALLQSKEEHLIVSTRQLAEDFARGFGKFRSAVCLEL